MITVTVYNETYKCEKAYKGSDYINLVDAKGMIIASFTGITDFSGFAISGGTWSTPADADDCFLAALRDDGVLVKGNNTCRDIRSALTTADTAATNLSSHTANKSNPHGVTKAQVGLGSVDNVKQMPISGGTFTGGVSAAAGTNDGVALLRNIMVIDASTDLSTLSVPAGTIIMVRK